MSDLLRVLAVLALVAANAFLVIGEYSVVTARRARLAARVEGGSRGAQAALRLKDDPVRVISTVQVGITAIGILTGAVGQPLVLDLLGDDLPEWLAFVIAFSVVTYLSVAFGELVPKALTLDRSEALATAVAIPIEIMTKALRPLRVLDAKTPAGVRRVDIHDDLQDELAAHKAARRSTWQPGTPAFLNARGKRWTRNAIAQHVMPPALKEANRQRAKAGLRAIREHVTPHTLRYTCIASLIAVGGPHFDRP
jgi:CBS domain containing-hemolysin-like protein